jgi:Flp pilus assembly protein TadG
MKALAQIFRDERGGPAAEFALMLPVTLLFLFGIIDVGRFLWEYNQAEKATQMGTRYAVATDIVASGLTAYSFARSCGVPQGSAISTAQFPGMTCAGGGTVAAPTATCTLSAASSCTATTIPTTASATAMGNIVNHMRLFKYDILPTNVTVTYANSGLGYAGDPNGLDVAPLVTVSVANLTFRPLTIMIFNATMPMPDFSYSLTMEDGSGTVSN